MERKEISVKKSRSDTGLKFFSKSVEQTQNTYFEDKQKQTIYS